MIQKLRNRLYSAFEEGFSLAEMVVVVLILGILAAISIPVYIGIQQQASTTTIKTGLLQAASIIEQEKTDLDGMYPRYLPNEVTQNELWKTFAYSYSDDRLTFCLQSFDNSNKAWFVSSTSKDPSQTICTQPNIGTNSTLPWAPNTPPVINVDSLKMAWNTAAATPTANLSWTAATCTNRDQTITPSTQYNVKLVDTSENVTITLKGLVGTTLSTDKLPGFLPSDPVQAYIQVVCVTQPASINSQTYYTTGSFGTTPATDTTPALPVPPTSYTTTPKASLTQNTSTGAFTMTAAGALAPITCPIGVAKYQITAAEPNAAGVTALSSTATTTNDPINWTLTNFQPDTKLTYTGDAYCVITRNNSASTLPLSYSSADVPSSETAPVGWPAGITNLATTNAYTGTGTTPNGLTWTGTTCTFGGTPNYSYMLDPNSATSGPTNGTYQPGTSAGAIAWAQGKSYTYYINAICVGSSSNTPQVQSVPTASSPSLKFTTDVVVPTPSFATNPNATFPSSTTMQATATANAVTCPGDSLAPLYSMNATTTANGASVTSNPSNSTSITMDISSLKTGSPVTYTLFATCPVKQYDYASNGRTVTYTSSSVYNTNTPGSAPSITTTSLADAINGNGYNQTVNVSGNPNPTFSVSSGSLPNGLSLNSGNGVISGTPNGASTSTFTIKASSISGVDTHTFTITVYNKPSIQTSSLNDALVNNGYSQTITSSGSGTITYTNISGGNSYNGLNLNSNGVINGTPNGTGTWNFTVQASNAYGTDTRNLSITIYQAAGWNNGSYPTSYYGQYYSNQVTGYGSGSLYYQVVGGGLPSGLGLNSGNGVISGTPNGAQSFSFTLRVSNNWGSQDRTFYVDTYKAPSINGTNCSNTTDVFNGLGCQVSYSTGYPNSSISFSGSLAPGLGINNGGYISGTPNSTGSYGECVTIYNNYSNSGCVGVGTETVNAYMQSLAGSGAGTSWGGQYNYDYSPCTFTFNGCSTSHSEVPSQYSGSYLAKFVSSGSNSATKTTINGTEYWGILGQNTRSLYGLQQGHQYYVSCMVGYASTVGTPKATSSANNIGSGSSGHGIAIIGINVSGSSYSVKTSPAAETPYNVSQNWTAGGGTATLAAMTLNNGTGGYEWYAGNCNITY